MVRGRYLNFAPQISMWNWIQKLHLYLKGDLRNGQEEITKSDRLSCRSFWIYCIAMDSFVKNNVLLKLEGFVLCSLSKPLAALERKGSVSRAFFMHLIKIDKVVVFK